MTVKTSVDLATTINDRIEPESRVARAAGALYDAECALQIAHQTHVDQWINAAADRLHEAVVEHRAACAANPRRSEPVAAHGAAA